MFPSKWRKLDWEIIILDGRRLTPTDNVKYFGMYLDNHLSWHQYIHKLSNTLSRANGILSKLRYNSPRNVCLNLYYSYLLLSLNLWLKHMGFNL